MFAIVRGFNSGTGDYFPCDLRYSHGATQMNHHFVIKAAHRMDQFGAKFCHCWRLQCAIADRLRLTYDTAQTVYTGIRRPSRQSSRSRLNLRLCHRLGVNTGSMCTTV